MSSFLEFNFNASSVPNGVLIAYGITTAAVVGSCTVYKNLHSYDMITQIQEHSMQIK